MNSLLCKDVRWKWTNYFAKAFQHIKDVLVSSTFVTHYDPSLPLRLAADASPYGLRAVISHVMEDGQEQPIAFASRTLSKIEQNYSQIEKEALALIFGVKKFHMYLCGRTFTLVTDHKLLTTIFGAKTLKSQEAPITSDEPAIFNVSQIESLPVTSQKLRTATRTDPVLSKVVSYV